MRRTVLCVMLCLVSSAAAAETVDNPAYLSWARHKHGTSVTVDNMMDMGGMSMTQSITYTLLEASADKAVIEHAITMDMAGTKRVVKNKVEVPAKVAKGSEELPPDFKGSAKEVGRETVEIAGKKYECAVIQFEGESPKGKASGKMWRNANIPGGMAKMDMNMTSPKPMTMKMVVTAIELK